MFNAEKSNVTHVYQVYMYESVSRDKKINERPGRATHVYWRGSLREVHIPFAFGHHGLQTYVLITRLLISQLRRTHIIIIIAWRDEYIFLYYRSKNAHLDALSVMNNDTIQAIFSCHKIMSHMYLDAQIYHAWWWILCVIFLCIMFVPPFACLIYLLWCNLNTVLCIFTWHIPILLQLSFMNKWWCAISFTYAFWLIWSSLVWYVPSSSHVNLCHVSSSYVIKTYQYNRMIS